MITSSQLSAPIVVIGMHRSGTTLLSRLLSDLGVEMGQSQDRHREALCFQSANDTLLRANGANWLNPHPFICRLSGSDFVAQMAELTRQALKDKISSFGELALEQKWGWKDPRTTLTLPIWLHLFPNLKVVHLIRNGVDVALSLQRRAWRNYLRPRHNDIERMFPLGSFIKGYHLWETYLQCAKSHTSYPRYYQLHYEDLVADPMGELVTLADFIGIAKNQSILSQVASEVRKPRERSWLEDVWLQKLFSLAILDSSLLERWGYAPPD